MGMPLHGARDNAFNLTVQDLERHRDATFLGENVVLVVSGNPANAQALQDSAAAKLGKWQTKPSDPINNSILDINLEAPLLTPSTMAVRDDEMKNFNTSVGFKAPAYGDADYFFLRYFQHIVGNYNGHEEGVAHLNASDRQYNMAHVWLGDSPGINLFRTDYNAYSDGGLFSTFIHGHEVWAMSMMYMGQFFTTEPSRSTNQAEVFRGRASFFNELLQNSRPSIANNLSIGRDLLYTGERIGRNELARRVSAMADQQHVMKMSKKYFYDVDFSAVFYGSYHANANWAYFDRAMRRSNTYGKDLWIFHWIK